MKVLFQLVNCLDLQVPLHMTSQPFIVALGDILPLGYCLEVLGYVVRGPCFVDVLALDLLFLDSLACLKAEAQLFLVTSSGGWLVGLRIVVLVEEQLGVLLVDLGLSCVNTVILLAYDQIILGAVDAGGAT